jgi:uncharacterized lipoprotein YajG
MNFPKLILLLAAVCLLAGCAGSNQASDDPPALDPVPTNDDSHGWGANVQGMSGR